MGTKQFDNYADLITFTRASGATYLDSDGVLKTASTNIPRIEYDADGNRLGLLVEEQRTNYVANSKSFAIGALGATASVTTSTTEPYYSGDTVKRITASAVNEGGLLNFSAALGGNHYCSFYVRSRTGAEQSLKITASGTVGVTQTVPASGEWVRLGRVASLGAGSRDMRVLSTGDPIDVDVCSPQAEFGAFPTSYIPTSGSTATRAADVASIPTSAFGYNASEGTVVVDATKSLTTANGRYFELSNASTNSRFSVFQQPTTITGFGLTEGATVCQLVISTAGIDQIKAGFTFTENDFAFCINGGSVSTDTAGAFPDDLSTLFIGKFPSSDAYQLNGHIKSIKYYPRRLSDAQLQELTQ